MKVLQPHGYQHQHGTACTSCLACFEIELGTSSVEGQAAAAPANQSAAFISMHEFRRSRQLNALERARDGFGFG